MSLQGDAQRQKLLELAPVHLRYDNPAVVELGQGALGHQPAQRLAHRRRAHLQRLGQAADRQGHPWPDPADHDPVAQPLVGPL